MDGEKSNHAKGVEGLSSPAWSRRWRLSSPYLGPNRSLFFHGNSSWQGIFLADRLPAPQVRSISKTGEDRYKIRCILLWTMSVQGLTDDSSPSSIISSSACLSNRLDVFLVQHIHLEHLQKLFHPINTSRRAKHQHSPSKRCDAPNLTHVTMGPGHVCADQRIKICALVNPLFTQICSRVKSRGSSIPGRRGTNGA